MAAGGTAVLLLTEERVGVAKKTIHAVVITCPLVVWIWAACQYKQEHRIGVVINITAFLKQMLDLLFAPMIKLILFLDVQTFR